MEEGRQFQNPEEEIRFLEQKILEKKKELGERDSRTLVSEALKEHAEKFVPQIPPPAVSSVQPVPASDDISRDVSLYVQAAFRDGVISAVKKVRQSHNPYLIDAFHDALVDRFSKELIERGLLPSHG
jgi:hypothetical protein